MGICAKEPAGLMACSCRGDGAKAWPVKAYSPEEHSITRLISNSVDIQIKRLHMDLPYSRNE